MLARRILLYAAVVLLALGIASALTPQDDGDDASPAATTTAPRADATRPTVRVTGTLTGEETVRATVGQIVEIRVDAEEADRVEIVELGLRGPVGPGLDTPLIVVTDRAGEFPVTLRFSGRRVGTLSVAAR